MHAAYVIQTQDLAKSFGGVQAPQSVTLEVPEHSIFGFLGPNGAGKTTTMKLLLGLIRPTGGGGTIFGRDIARESVDIRSWVGYLPQEPRFYEYMTARETLAFTLRFFFRGPQSAIDDRVAEVLELVGMAVLGVYQLFYLTLTLMLGTLFNHRAPVIAIPLALAFGQSMLLSMAPFLSSVLPWTLIAPLGETGHSVAESVILGLSDFTLFPLVPTAVLTGVFIAVGLWRFEQEEF